MAAEITEVPMGNLNGASPNGRSSAQTTVGHGTPRQLATPEAEDEEKLIGSWLCTPGRYQEYIAALSDCYPGLRTADPNNLAGDGGAPLMTAGNAHVVMLDASATGSPKFTRTEFRDATHLKTHLKDSVRDHDRRRIYIMEGLATDFVAAIGGHFWMDPTFWLRQERTCVWSNDFTPVSDALPQPSLIDPEKSFHVQYCELREFTKALETVPCFCARTKRHVGMTAPRHANIKKDFKNKSAGSDNSKVKSKTNAKSEGRGNTTTAIVRRKVSWWSEKTATRGGWDVVILCDPQLAQMTRYPREKVYNKRTETYDLREIADPDVNLLNEPFQGGYTEFVPPTRLKPGQLPSGPRHPHKSMLYDLVYYYESKSGLLEEHEWNDPSESAIFLKKIVAAHYLQLADYIKVMLPSLELKLATAWVEEQEQWKALQTISRRCGNYRDDIEDALLSLGFPLVSPAQKAIKGARKKIYDWKDCEIDYQYAYLRLQVLKERADNLMTSMTGFASIAGNRQSLDEAKRVKRLNLLALLFIPLAYTSSLFSMQDNYAPNKPQFWVYWVCAIGVVIFTTVVTWVLDRSLNDEAQFTLDSFLEVLGWSNKGASTKMKRTKTAFWPKA
ncbi:hypothetical protein C7974DRAFT_160311 [Boeremia exigua]|uniref:uncharacterized protein n=1 Tax=Boeremia exigua TaxID=749465 RepID=UPI001E8D70B6|nr:uncharacterized protein C7974DRAFT_160311 [Boeremia exigua]KAH6638418.1 hypothetical protein C7974DRAFT_160311 [Boeremia exigua]